MMRGSRPVMYRLFMTRWWRRRTVVVMVAAGETESQGKKRSTGKQAIHELPLLLWLSLL